MTTLETTDLASIESEPLKEVPEITCQECGTDITHLWGGRGRKPTKCEQHRKSRSGSNVGGTARNANAVKLACDNLDTAYNAIGFLLAAFGMHTAASDLAASVDTLRKQNEQFLSRDPKLVRMLNKGGATTGRVGFIMANAMVLGPVAITAAGELRALRQTTVEDEDQEDAFAAFKPGGTE